MKRIVLGSLLSCMLVGQAFGADNALVRIDQSIDVAQVMPNQSTITNNQPISDGLGFVTGCVAGGLAGIGSIGLMEAGIGLKHVSGLSYAMVGYEPFMINMSNDKPLRANNYKFYNTISLCGYTLLGPTLGGLGSRSNQAVNAEADSVWSIRTRLIAGLGAIMGYGLVGYCYYKNMDAIRSSGLDLAKRFADCLLGKSID